jgi:hypothetical protein
MGSLAVVRDIRSPRSLGSPADAAAYQEDLLAEFVLARSAHGVADATVRAELAAVSEFLDCVGCFAWEVEARHGDRFLGEAQRGRAVKTRQVKAGRIACLYRFLEVRYQGEIHALTGRVVTSPIDAVNRPANTGSFAVRVPPSPPELAAFFARWRDALAEAASGAPRRVTTRWPGWPARWACARPSCAGWRWMTCISTTGRWARSTSVWARAPAARGPGSGWCRCSVLPGRCWGGG